METAVLPVQNRLNLREYHKSQSENKRITQSERSRHCTCPHVGSAVAQQVFSTLAISSFSAPATAGLVKEKGGVQVHDPLIVLPFGKLT